MSDSDDSEPKYDLYKYSLVRFVHKGRKRQVESIDIIPSKWLDFDKAKGRCVTKFLDGPYNKEDLQLLHELVKNNVDPPEDWPVFSVDQVGRAKTYKEALNKLDKLQTSDNVFTMESEDSASEVQAQLTEAVKRQKLQAEARKLNEIFSLLGNKESQTVQATTSSDTTRGKRKQKNASNVSSTAAHEKKTSIKKQKTTPIKSTNFNTDENTNKKDALVDQHGDEKKSNLLDKEPISASFSGDSPIKALEDSIEFNENDIMNAPVVLMNNMQCTTPFEEAVLLRLDNIYETMNYMRNEQIQMKSDICDLKASHSETSKFLSDKKLMEKTSINLQEKYEVEIPISTIEAFNDFENKLKNNNYFKKDVFIELKSAMDHDLNISKSLVKMLKKFMTKDLAQNYTAIRSSTVNKNKIKFKPTQFCSLIEVVITRMRKEKGLQVEPADFNASLTDVLTNVIKWKSSI